MKQRVCIALIRTAVKVKVTRQLAFFYLLKRQFANGRIYDFRSRKNMISKLLGVSIKTLNKYLDTLEQVELISEECGNLVLVSNRRIKQVYNEEKTYKISTHKDDSLEDIQARLFAKLLEHHARKICFKESLRRFEKRCFLKWNRSSKAEGGGDQLNSVLRENPRFEPSMSVRTVAKLLSLNEKTALKIIERLNKLDIVQTESQQPILAGPSSSNVIKYMQEGHGYWFVCKGKLYQQFGMKWNFLEFPIFQKQLTGRAYVKINRIARC